MFKDWYDIKETLKLFGTIFFIVALYGYASDDDYHILIDKSRPVKYNCNILMGGWHPDVPQQVIEECRKLIKENNDNRNNRT